MFSFNEFPSQPGIYRITLSMERAIPESVFTEYWQKWGKAKIIELCEGTPFLVGMFYQPGGVNPDGSLIPPFRDGWQTTDFLVGDEFETKFASDPNMQAWFEPGNIVVRPFESGGSTFVNDLTFHLMVFDEIDFTDIRTTFDPVDVLIDILLAEPSSLGSYSHLGQGFWTGFTTTLGKKTATYLFGLLVIIVVFFALGPGVIAYCKRWWIAAKGDVKKKVESSVKTGVEQGSDTIAAKMKKAVTDGVNQVTGDVKDRLAAAGERGKAALEAAKKATTAPLTIILWIVAGAGAIYGLGKLLTWLTKKEEKRELFEGKRGLLTRGSLD